MGQWKGVPELQFFVYPKGLKYPLKEELTVRSVIAPGPEEDLDGVQTARHFFGDRE